MQLGFVGLGAMGQLIVPRLMAAGHTVTGWNRSREKAAPLIKAGTRELRLSHISGYVFPLPPTAKPLPAAVKPLPPMANSPLFSFSLVLLINIMRPPQLLELRVCRVFEP